jgi:hypothetical protein
MWKLVQKETTDSKAPLALALDVANALKRMWKAEEGGTLRTWQPGTTGSMHDNSSMLRMLGIMLGMMLGIMLGMLGMPASE